MKVLWGEGPETFPGESLSPASISAREPCSHVNVGPRFQFLEGMNFIGYNKSIHVSFLPISYSSSTCFLLSFSPLCLSLHLFNFFCQFSPPDTSGTRLSETRSVCKLWTHTGGRTSEMHLTFRIMSGVRANPSALSIWLLYLLFK